MKKLIIFDLDGTLLNTIEDLATSVNYALGRWGFPTHEISAYRYFVGKGVTNLLYTALPENERTTKNIEKVREVFLQHYSQNGVNSTKPYPGIENLLSKLQDDGIILAVASNKHHEATCKMISHYFPDIDFCAVLGQREGFPAKPDPSIVNEILEITKIPCDDALYVGDSGVDMMTASASCIKSVGVSWGFRPVSELTEHGADFIVDSADEIYNLCIH